MFLSVINYLNEFFVCSFMEEKGYGINPVMERGGQGRLKVGPQFSVGEEISIGLEGVSTGDLYVDGNGYILDLQNLSQKRGEFWMRTDVCFLYLSKEQGEDLKKRLGAFKDRSPRIVIKGSLEVSLLIDPKES